MPPYFAFQAYRGANAVPSAHIGCLPPCLLLPPSSVILIASSEELRAASHQGSRLLRTAPQSANSGPFRFRFRHRILLSIRLRPSL
jgi:hypothetical protein